MNAPLTLIIDDPRFALSWKRGNHISTIPAPSHLSHLIESLPVPAQPPCDIFPVPAHVRHFLPMLTPVPLHIPQGTLPLPLQPGQSIGTVPSPRHFGHVGIDLFLF